jgi:low affinity Fe/Cu permease
MKLDVALIIISSVTLFGVIIFYISTNILRNKIDELVRSKKRKKKSRSSSQKS